MGRRHGRNRSGDLREPVDLVFEVDSKAFNDGRRRNAVVLERALSLGRVATLHTTPGSSEGPSYLLEMAREAGLTRKSLKSRQNGRSAQRAKLGSLSRVPESLY